jgi:hypothetical protein
MVACHEYLSPTSPRLWAEPIKQQIRQRAEGVKPLGARWGLTAPQPFGLPAAPAELIDAVRNGVATAITDWADFLDKAGAAEAAKLLRWLPEFRASRAEEVQAVCPQFGFAITANSNGHSWWWIGDAGSECDNDEARNLNRLMSAWNEMHPAVEWLLRSYGFPHVTIESLRFATDDRYPNKSYDLTAGQHLEPVADDARVLRLDVQGWVPIEGMPEGE